MLQRVVCCQGIKTSGTALQQPQPLIASQLYQRAILLLPTLIWCQLLLGLRLQKPVPLVRSVSCCDHTRCDQGVHAAPFSSAVSFFKQHCHRLGWGPKQTAEQAKGVAESSTAGDEGMGRFHFSPNMLLCSVLCAVCIVTRVASQRHGQHVLKTL